MRCNQVSINIERFGKYVPESYPGDVQRIKVYCDDYNSIYVALSKAYALAVNELAEHERVGVRTDVYTNEFSNMNYFEMHAALPQSKRKFEEDVNLEYYDTDIELCKLLIWAYEHTDAMIEVIRYSQDKENYNTELKENFGLNEYQIRKLSQIRLDMLTKENYLATKEKAKKMQEIQRMNNTKNAQEES